ncbi:olfactory receptor 2T33 [Fukomys damarensis]|uniref:Olfactory receptor n=1 Tax=Fukomys damarensis TaxID=885580 RepID=A0A091EI46_FUKDA|nr:olfactory receptor 2T33 [Fukomys damarensis]KFO35146.1 Olfactory receptor 2T33 [Fukomys damarensis]
MKYSNDTTEMNFILLGLSDHSRLHQILFSLVLVIFLASLVGNSLMIFLIWEDPQLRTPMYFLLSQLSLMDMTLVSSIIPKMVTNYLLHMRSISPTGCGVQIFLFLTLGGGECFLLAAMSYDRYVAICHLLRYHLFMSKKRCWHMAAGSWLLGGLDGLMQADATLSFPYCRAREINHFFCEALSLVHLACANRAIFEFFMSICCILMLLVPLSLILASYMLILARVPRIQATEARKKAFATCSSHLAVVGLFFGTIMFIYVRPKSSWPLGCDKVVPAFYTIITPVLNPLIYSVRNKEVKGALRKWLQKHIM